MLWRPAAGGGGGGGRCYHGQVGLRAVRRLCSEARYCAETLESSGAAPERGWTFGFDRPVRARPGRLAAAGRLLHSAGCKSTECKRSGSSANHIRQLSAAPPRWAALEVVQPCTPQCETTGSRVPWLPQDGGAHTVGSTKFLRWKPTRGMRLVRLPRQATGGVV